MAKSEFDYALPWFRAIVEETYIVRCYHEIRLQNGAYSHCHLPFGHEGEHEKILAIKPVRPGEPEPKTIEQIPCSCLDCKAKREGTGPRQ